MKEVIKFNIIIKKIYYGLRLSTLRGALWTGDIKYYDWRVGRRIGIVGIVGRDLGGFV